VGEFGRAPFIFGRVKPVPAYFQKLRHPRRDMVIVAAAGPLANLVLEVGSGLFLHVTAFFSSGGGNMACADIEERDIRPYPLGGFQYAADPTVRRWPGCGRPAVEIASPSLGPPGALGFFHITGCEAVSTGHCRGLGRPFRLVFNNYFARHRHTI